MIYHSESVDSETVRSPVSKRAILLLAAIAGLASPHFVSAATTATWNGTTGNWSDPTKWSTNPLVPTSTAFDVVINAGSLTNDVNPTVQTLTWNGGSIIDGQLTVNGGLSLPGAADTFLSGTLTNAAGQLATMGSAGAATAYFRSSGTFNNLGTFTATNGQISVASGSNSLFNNTGTLNVNLTNPAGVFGISYAAFTNSGTVNVQSGTLQAAYGGGSSSGSFNVSPGATLAFGIGQGNTYTLAASSSLTVAGTLAFSGDIVNANGTTYNVTGAVLVTGGITNFNANAVFAAPVTQSSGTVGGTGLLTVNGLYTLSGGTITASGVIANGGLSLPGVTDTVLTGTLTNAAGHTATMGSAGAGVFYISGFGAFNNAGTFTATNGEVSVGFGSGSVFSNSGTFNVNLTNSAGVFGVTYAAFSNAGTVNVQSGTLRLGSGGGTSSGAFNVSPGATLQFGVGQGNTYTLTATSSMTVAGTLVFAGDIVNANGTSYNVTGAVLVSGGVTNFNANAVLSAPVTQSSGTVGGTGLLTVNGLYTWSGGTITTSGVDAHGGLSLPGGTDTVLTGILTNAAGQAGTMGSAGGGTFYISGGGTFVNAGTFTATNGQVSVGYGSGSQFNNTGTFNVNLASPAGVFGITYADFNNSGTVNVQRGTLSINGNSNATTGSYFVVAAASLISDGLRATTLTVDGNAMIRGTSAVTGTSKVAGLSMSHTGSVYSGVLNINNTHFIIQPSSGDKAVQLAAVSAAIASAKGSGNWVGNGLTSATTAADPLNKTIAVADNAILGLTTFGGLPVDGNSILLVSTWLGDANLDRSVNVSDLGTLATNYGHPTTLGAVAGDFNIDGVINVTDLGLLATNYGKGTGGGAFNLESEPTPEVTPYSSFAASIPEPGTLLLLGFPFLMSRKSWVIKGSRRGGRQGRSIRVL